MMKINNDIIFGLLLFGLGIFLKFLPNFDIRLLEFFNSFLFSEVFFTYFTEFGNGWFVVALVIPILSFISYQSKQLSNVPMQALIISGIYIGLIVQILKEEVFPFTRPALEMLDSVNYVEPIFRYASFPSGHAATIFGVVLFWIKLTSVENLKLANKLILYIVLGFAFCVALSRVIIAAHWFTDVLASLGLVLVLRSALSLNLVRSHLMEGNIGKYFSYFLVLIAWLGIIFFDVTEYF